MRPPLRVDLVNRVEQDDVLHVGERREARRHERDAVPPPALRERKGDAVGFVAFCDQELGGDEIVEQLVTDALISSPPVVSYRCSSWCTMLSDLVSALDPVPDLRPLSLAS